MTSTRRQALALSVFTVGYNLAEGVIAIIASSLSGSTALLGFGLDSFVESLSGLVMVWRFWNYDPDADEEEKKKGKPQIAQRKNCKKGKRHRRRRRRRRRKIERKGG